MKKIIVMLRIKFYDRLNAYHVSKYAKFYDYPLVKAYHSGKADYYWDKCIEISAKYGDKE